MLGQVGDTDGLQVALKSAVLLSLLVVGVTNFDISLEPSILKLDHLFECGDSCGDITHLNANLSNTSKVVEVLFVFNSRDAALCELRHVLTEQVLSQIDQNFVLLNVCQANVSEGFCRFDLIRWRRFGLSGIHSR